MRSGKRITMVVLLAIAALLFNIGSMSITDVSAAEVEEISPTYPMKKVVLAGTYYEIGLQLGNFARKAGVQAKKMTDADRDRQLQYKEFYEEVYPPFVDELRGIWAAFDLNYDDMEFEVEEIPIDGQKLGWRITGNMLTPACSAFSLPAEATTDRAVLFGRNFDWARMPCAMVFMYPEGAYSSVGCTAYDVGSTLTDGMNSEGLRICINAVPNLGTPQANPGLAHGCAIRVMLDTCATVDEAIDLLQRTPLSFPLNMVHFLIADGNGDSVVLEFNGKEIVVVRPDNGYQVMTNSYLFNNSTAGCWRYQTAERMIKENYGSIDDQLAKDILRAIRLPHTQWSVVYKYGSGGVLISLADKPTEFHEFSFATRANIMTPVQIIGMLSTTWGQVKNGYVIGR